VRGVWGLVGSGLSIVMVVVYEHTVTSQQFLQFASRCNLIKFGCVRICKCSSRVDGSCMLKR